MKADSSAQPKSRTPPAPPSGLSRLAVSLSNRLDERKRAEDVGELGFGQAVKRGDARCWDERWTCPPLGSTPLDGRAAGNAAVALWRRDCEARCQLDCVVVTLRKPALVERMLSKAIVVIDPELMSGTPCFAGTRVPVRSLLDYIEGGDTLDEFLEQFPTVSREQAIGFLEQSSEHLLAATDTKS
jgi:uncharacterized protein (DUF433 family)